MLNTTQDVDGRQRAGNKKVRVCARVFVSLSLFVCVCGVIGWLFVCLVDNLTNGTHVKHHTGWEREAAPRED
jgi:hypothetical protein